MERGDLVPDEVTIAMVRDRLCEDDAQPGFLLDGFPRNVPQAETLEKMLSEWETKLEVVLELVVDDDEVVRRLSGRRTCHRCGRVWHVLFDPPARRDTCDDCSGDLFQRVAGGSTDTHGRHRRRDLHVAGVRDLAGDEGEAALHQAEQRIVGSAVRIVHVVVQRHPRVGHTSLSG